MSRVVQFAGWCEYQTDLQIDRHSLLVSIYCRVGSIPVMTDALLDTASEWCVIARKLLPWAEDTGWSSGEVALSTRLGTIRGGIERIPLTFLSHDGDQVTIDATFLSRTNGTVPR